MSGRASNHDVRKAISTRPTEPTDPDRIQAVLPDSARDSVVSVQRLFFGVAFVAGALTATIASLTLVGWAADVESLQRGGTRFAPMMPATAVALIALGSSLVALAGRPGRARAWGARAAAVFAAMVGLLTLIQYTVPWEIGMDLLLFPEALADEGLPYPGRMEPAAAVALLLLGLSLSVYDLASERVHRGAEILVIVAMLIGLETLFGYAFGMEALGGIARFPTVPIHTALALLCLSVGTAVLRTQRGRLRILASPGAAGVALRRLIPVSVAGPFLVGWLIFLGVAAGFFSGATGLTLFVSLICALLLFVVGWTIQELNRIDHERVTLLWREREARDEAEDANRAKDKFLGVMSHELRTPLNSVLSYAALLDAGIKGPLNDDQREYVERIRRSGEHLASMIEEILQFARSQQGVLEADTRPVDAVELAREALAVVAHEVDHEAVEIHRQLPAGPVEIRTDPEKVLQVLVNLLGNALKFTKEGRVGIRMWSEEGRLAYEVWDTGPGIPPEDRERVFKEFAQLEPNVNGRKGTGLGLAISRAYAEVVGGRLELDSWVGRGSVFRLVLPLEAPEADVGAATAAPLLGRSPNA